MVDDDAKAASAPPGPPSFPVALAGIPRVQVEVNEPAFISGEVRLSDGTTLKIRVIIVRANRLEGILDEGGQPVYQVDSVIIPSVVTPKKGE